MTISPARKELFDALWKDYTAVSPSADKIYRFLGSKDGAPVINDHIAFRTYNRGPVRLESFVKALAHFGYSPQGTYFFKEKKLRAHHFEADAAPVADAAPEADAALEGDAAPMPGKGIVDARHNASSQCPRIFVSELICDEFSPSANRIIDDLIARTSDDLEGSPDLLCANSAWPAISFAGYETLMKESEYAAWVAAYRIRANHFTAAVHTMRTLESLEQVVKLLEEAGYTLNKSGGVIKGSPRQLLEQASTMADKIEWQFADGVHLIPSCYYEFARRYPDKDGALYGGFIEKSADKIFESTN